MNWIDLRYTMPQPGRRALVRFLNGDNQIPRCTIGVYYPKYYMDASCCDNDPKEWADEHPETGELYWPEGWWEDVVLAEQVDSIKNVTHWMPLPSVKIEFNPPQQPATDAGEGAK